MCMKNIISAQTLADFKLKQWQNSLNFNPLEKNSYEKLVGRINTGSLFAGALKNDVSIPLLLSMIVELKNELEEIQDEFELSKIREFRGG